MAVNVEWPSSNQKGYWLDSSPRHCLEVSLSKTQNPQLLLIIWLTLCMAAHRCKVCVNAAVKRFGIC